MQPRIKTDNAALRQLCTQPICQRYLGPCDRRIDIRDLRFDLRAIAPVDEHARHIPQGGTEASRSGKPCQPLQPVIAGGNIFALMGIGAGHQKPVKRVGSQLLAQRGQPWRPLFRPRGHLERLKHVPTPFFILLLKLPAERP